MTMPYQFKNFHWARDIRINAYLIPRTLDEALDLLEKYQGKAQVVAGGTDVISQLRQRDLEVEALVDITRLPDMDGIRQDGEMITLGGCVTHAQTASSPLVREKAAILAKAAGSLGSPQIRNIATVAGNLVSGHPAADTSIPLLSLNASVLIASKEGQRVVPLTEFFLDKGRTAIDCRKEILVQIRFPALQRNQGGCHLRLSKRHSLTIAILALAAVVKVHPQKKIIQEAAIAMGPVAPTPFRAAETEALLAGAPVCKETIERAAKSAYAEANPIDSAIWGSAEYKREMVKVFVKRGLENALIETGANVD
jgi:carbon-monoxide dehydrogenase medium subunit